MPFPTIDNDLLNIGILQGQIPVIGAGNKLPGSIINSGTGANQLVQLDNTGKLPALDASLLTNLPSSGSGSRVLIDTQIASNSAQIDFTTGINNSFKRHLIEIDDVHFSSGNLSLNMVFSNNGGSSYIAGSSYQYVLETSASGFNSDDYDSVHNNAAFEIRIASECTSTNSLTIAANIHLSNLAGASTAPMVFGTSVYPGTGIGTRGGTLIGSLASTTDVNAIRIRPSAATLVKGTFRLYGLS